MSAGRKSAENSEEKHVEVEAEGDAHPDKAAPMQPRDKAQDVGSQPGEDDAKVKLVPTVSQVFAQTIQTGSALAA